MPDFVHLHCHTEYSLLDGAIRLKDLCKAAHEFGLPAAAITDHGNLYGAVKFYLTAKDFGLKPVIGCEVYLAKTHHQDRESDDARTRYHLVLLAQDLAGYRNLVKLVSTGCTEGFHYKPRVDRELLARHSEGLIALSACLQGEVPRALMDHGFDAGLRKAREYEAMFPGRFYLEMQANGLAAQDRLNSMLLDLARETSLPLVGTNDCHYLAKDDCEAHDILLCVGTGAVVEDEKRMRMDDALLHYRPPQEMEKAFAHCPEALANTVRIAELCNVELPLGRNVFPVYDTGGLSLDEAMADMARKGLEARLAAMPYAVDADAYRARLELELGVIRNMGFSGYFLIVADFINWAKDHRIPVGPGRGSAAGSLAAYAMRITNLDPIPYNLLFERFLNPERVSMPDIDVDFCERRRGEVIRYVSEKYGEDKVSQITTFGTMKAKAVVRDVGRALGLTFAETDKIAKLIPEDLKMTIAKALDMEPELTGAARADARVAKLLDVSRRLEGMHRHASTHAAGVVIADRSLTDYLPLYRGKKNEIVSQFDMKMVEKVGLIKFDFLGLRTMTVIQDCLDIIEEGAPGTAPDLDTLALTDERTYALYSRGDTDGIFQVESDGMRRYLRMLRPTCFDDLIAMLALYRPGPLGSGMVDEFIKRKHGESEVVYPLPSLEPVLRDTYGVIVYQEQVMKIAQVVAGYTLGGADLLRRAMGKKNPEAMAAQRQVFLEGAARNGVDAKKAGEIFDLMEKFAEYGFNKSHSAAYALISYHTAYLKTHFPTQFMAALMTSELSNQDKILKYIGACRDMDIAVRQPDLNQSQRHFTVPEPGTVVFGLGGVKNVGDEAIREIADARAAEGPYGSLLDLCSRVNLRKVTKRVLESLVKAGAMDSLGVPRRHLLENLDRVVAVAQKRAKDRESGQMSLLAMSGAAPPPEPGLGLAGDGPPPEEWPEDEKLRQEKEVLGFFLTSHPLLAFRREIRRLRLLDLSRAADMPHKTEVRLALIVTAQKEHYTKKGDKMAFLTVEDLSGSGEMTLFPDIWKDAKPLVEADEPLLVTAEVDARNNGPAPAAAGDDDEEQPPKVAKLLGKAVGRLADALTATNEPVVLDMPGNALDEAGLERLTGLAKAHPGQTPLRVRLVLPECDCLIELSKDHCVFVTPEFWRAVDDWLGRP
ncbi:MAG: DNA polymerase III subunit alpha [Thermodesulfobacteriota bacterium]